MEIIIALAFADVLVVLLVCKCYTATQQQYYAHSQQQARDRLLYIQTLIELVYTHKHDPKKLLENFARQMTIRQVLISHVVDDDCNSLIPADLKIRQDDKLLYKLYEEGFTAQALCVLFDLNNINSVYVKCHRVNKRLKKEDIEEEPAETA